MQPLIVLATVPALVVAMLGSATAASADATPSAAPDAGHDHSDHAHPAELPVPEPARGIVTTGLAVATDGPCEGLLQAVDAPGHICTHGPDPAPASLGDIRTATGDELLTDAELVAPAFACDGDGATGRRAHAIYAVTPDRTDRFATYEDAFKAVLANVQDEFRQSSLLHGATDPAVFRFTHTRPVGGTCEALLDHVVLPDPADDDSFGATIAALTELGYSDPTRRYLVFADANLFCGVGQYYHDDRADPTKNWNNIEYKPLFSRVDAGCWGYAETHELTHNLGGVQSSAPNTSGSGHCNDDHDLMCYADGGSLSALQVVVGCELASLWERRLDCGGDDYFNPSPPSGSYLDTHWNTADSGWLFTEKGLVQEPEPEPESEPEPEPTAGTAPTVLIGTPIAGVTDRTLTFSGKAADVDGDLRSVRMYVDGGHVATVATSGSWSRSLTVAPGARTLAVQAVDAKGNASKRQSVAVTALFDMPSPAGSLFVDDAGSMFEPAIERLAVQGVTRGCNPPLNDQFCPGDPVTRGQMAAFLVRALDLPAASGIDFTDDNNSIFEDAIERLAGAGITRGCNPPSNTRFCPGDPVTRGQMAAFLVRALDLPAASGIDFTDDNNSIFEDAIERLAGAGITRGCNPPSNTRFCPGDPVTHAQMAAFLQRALYT